MHNPNPKAATKPAPPPNPPALETRLRTGLAANRVAAQIRARVARELLADQSTLFNVLVQADDGSHITLAAESRENAERLAAELNRVAWIEVRRS